MLDVTFLQKKKRQMDKTQFCLVIDKLYIFLKASFAIFSTLFFLSLFILIFRDDLWS